jgi:hypothetical protein
VPARRRCWCCDVFDALRFRNLQMFRDFLRTSANIRRDGGPGRPGMSA